MEDRPQPQWDTVFYAAEFLLVGMIVYVAVIFQPPSPKVINVNLPREYYKSDEAWEAAKQGIAKEYRKPDHPNPTSLAGGSDLPAPAR